MMSRAQSIVFGLLLVFAFAMGWLVSGWRAGEKIARIELAQSSKELQQTQQTIKQLDKTQKDFSNALSNFQKTQQVNAQSQADLGKLLLDLRSTTAGLRSDFANLPARIERASGHALAEYAATCSAVFEEMAAGGQRLSEAGAGISAKADGHAADAQLGK
ncbi:hypothetical protein CTR2_R40040 [Comamonas thiooxydans]|uniref:hypothetical protein n=1 Tax=Comamonas thiooxydans TaxID=363952 RepID=UPI000B34F850|nr:hypothetical protein [Comamonas thiooxydans]BDR10666.1 hypothetical protein CTR2_R40040 [Comamonas thiooxydans]